MATAGDNHLGGQDFVDNMMKHCIQEITEKFGIEVAEDSQLSVSYAWNASRLNTCFRPLLRDFGDKKNNQRRSKL